MTHENPVAPVLQGWEELLELLERQRDRGLLCTPRFLNPESAAAPRCRAGRSCWSGSGTAGSRAPYDRHV